MKKLSKQDLDAAILEMIKQRDRLAPHVQKYLDEIIPLAKQYKDKAVNEVLPLAKEYKDKAVNEVLPLAKEYKDKAVYEYQTHTLPKIIKHKKVMLTLFYFYTMTSNFRLSEKRQEWKAKVGKMIR